MYTTFISIKYNNYFDIVGLLESDNANRLCSSLKVGILIPWINSINLPSTFITIQNQFVQRMTQLVVSGPLDHIKDDLVLLDSEDVLYGTKNWEMVCCLLHALNKVYSILYFTRVK